jgi:hypothetical protein
VTYIALKEFSGIAPRVGPTNLAPNQAQKARNVKLQSGELRPWRRPLFTYAPSGSVTGTIYKMVNPSSGASRWLEFSGDVNVVAGPIADVSEVRVYYTGDTTPRKTNWALATSNGAGTKPFPNAYLQMGVPAPAAAPTLSASGGSGGTETRAYVYTYVSTFGAVQEESAPSPAATVTCNVTGATVVVSAFSTAPTSAAGYNITSLRIYRTIGSLYTYVGQVTVSPSTGAASGSFSDTTNTANLIGVPLTSLYYTPPPSGLQGLVAMPNGILAGFVGNQVWFCEPYLPHAWPSAYMMTVGAPIVGLGVFGQTLVVCTTSNPYLISGSTPGGMSQEKLPLPEPCVSKLSIASDMFGVLYASPNGVVSVGPGTMDVISRPLMTRDEWQTYTPGTMKGAIYQNMYLLFYTTSGDAGALVLMRGDTPPLVTLETEARAVFVENSTASVYVVSPDDNLIYQLDADPVNNLFYEWTSKRFILPSPQNFAALQVHADWTYLTDTGAYNASIAEIIAANQAIWAAGPINGAINTRVLNTGTLNGSLLAELPSAADLRNITAIVLGDDVQITAVGLTGDDPVRMPAAGKAYNYEVKLTGNAPLRTFAMASAIQELKAL